MKTIVMLIGALALAGTVVFAPAAAMAGDADLADLCRLDGRETFFFSPENPKGVRGGGNAKPNCKESPSVFLDPGQTCVLAEIDGPGRIESIWIGNSALMLTSPHTGRNCYFPMPFHRHTRPNRWSNCGSFRSVASGCGFRCCRRLRTMRRLWCAGVPYPRRPNARTGRRSCEV